MERIKCLNLYQKKILLFIVLMMLVFTVIYPIIIAREGFAYKDAILIPNQENDNVVYTGKIQGKQASFTVSPEKTVEFRYGDKFYGPYTLKVDSSAIPKSKEMEEFMTGIELRKGEQILFRGGVLSHGEYRFLYNEDGSLEDSGISITVDNGIVTEENGRIIDPMEPSASTILDLMGEPELTHKGEWISWFWGIAVCIVTGISILFADELFRWNLAFQIRNADYAEPSDWEIAGRYIAWTGLPIMAMIIFVWGLQ